MKTLLFSLLLVISVQASALDEALNQCVADRLQAYNSDAYYYLSVTDVESMLTIPEMFGHIDAINAKARCELISFNGVLTVKGTTCVANTLQAYNSDIYYNLSAREVNLMLDNVLATGHSDAMNAARLCKIY